LAPSNIDKQLDATAAALARATQLFEKFEHSPLMTRKVRSGAQPGGTENQQQKPLQQQQQQQARPRIKFT
jgi:hypothetical protein